MRKRSFSTSYWTHKRNISWIWRKGNTGIKTRLKNLLSNFTGRPGTRLGGKPKIKILNLGNGAKNTAILSSRLSIGSNITIGDSKNWGRNGKLNFSWLSGQALMTSCHISKARTPPRPIKKILRSCPWTKTHLVRGPQCTQMIVCPWISPRTCLGRRRARRNFQINSRQIMMM